MNKMLMMVAATMAFAAFAQEPPAPPPAGEGAPRPEAMAKRPPRPPMMMGQGFGDPLMRAVMNPKVAEKIGLTDDQKKKLEALKGDKSANHGMQEKIRKGMDRQVELLKAEKIDEGAVMAAIDEVFEARKAVAKAQTKRMIAVRSILTPEQVSKALEAMKAERGSRMHRNGPNDRGPHGAGPKGKGPKGEAPRCEGGSCRPQPEE